MLPRLTKRELRALLLAANEIEAGEQDGWSEADIEALKSAIEKLKARHVGND